VIDRDREPNASSGRSNRCHAKLDSDNQRPFQAWTSQTVATFQVFRLMRSQGFVSLGSPGAVSSPPRALPNPATHGQRFNDPHDAAKRARDLVVESRGTSTDAERFLAQLGSSMGFASQSQGGLTPIDQIDSLYGWVYVCVERIRSSMAQVPLRVKRRGKGKEEPETIDDLGHPLVKLFENPNPLDTQFDLWAATITYQLLCGTGYWLKTRGGRNEVREIWPMPSQYMYPLFTNDRKALWGYEMRGLGETIQIPTSELVVLQNFNPQNRFVGYSTLAAASEATQSTDALRAARLKALDNDILSSKFFTTDQRLTEDEWLRTVALITTRNGGPDNAGRPVLLHGGVKPASLDSGSQELPFRESDKDNRDEILGVFGVPPLLAGIVENANNSNTASQETVYAKYTIAPKCVAIQKRINKDLLPEFKDPSLYVEFDNCVPKDKLQNATIASANVGAGITTINEERGDLGLAAVPWGDVPRWMAEAQAVGAAAIAGAGVDDPNNPEGLDETLGGETSNDPLNGAQVGSIVDIAKLVADGTLTPESAKALIAAAFPTMTPEQIAGIVDNIEIGVIPNEAQAKAGITPAQPNTEEIESDVQAGGPSSERKMLGRRSPALRRRYLEVLGRSIGKDYKSLVKSTVPTLRKYFANQAKRVRDNVVRIYSHLPKNEPKDPRPFIETREPVTAEEKELVAAGHGVTLASCGHIVGQCRCLHGANLIKSVLLDPCEDCKAYETVEREFAFVDLGEKRAARLYVDGTIVEEYGDARRGILGRATEAPSRCLDHVSHRTIQVRELPGSVVDQLDHWEKAAEELAGRMLPKIKDSLEAGTRMQLDELRIQVDGPAAPGALDMNSPTVEKWLQQKQRDYWEGTVDETTKRLLSERLADVLADRPTLSKMVDVVEEVMGGRINSSAETIARTEVIGAYNAGSDITRGEMGVTKKEWVATYDGRTRMSHADADGQIVRQDDTFDVGGEALAYPGDPRASTANICNCRCASVAIIDDE
jgi:HK97 family phage portal protein